MSQSDTLSNSIKNANISNEAQIIIDDIDTVHKELDVLQQEIDKVIFGQKHVIEYALTAILAGGHALLVGAPGLAKTRLVETLGTVLGLNGKRIQFTPDLMPSDIIGSEIMDSDENGKRSFRYIKGPIFTQLLMADEINRASPRTQSALLQAMQEYHVTVAGVHYDLPQPFHVLATQNPLEQEGTYPLPEAQLDRFLMQIDIDYPDLTTERRIILETTIEKTQSAQPILSAEKLQKIQKIVRKMPISENVVDAILKLVRSARPDKDNTFANNYVAWGPGPRASQALSLCARARALYYGRLAPSLDDVATLAQPVLQHRMALNFSARAEDVTIKNIIDTLVKDAL
ncbi:AAA family ATPase [Bartonella sp. CB74]|uniref:AAA family ATPase n=1 Tax=Bartonella sp. CB74 TaxID=3113620 RepID=UPI002F96476F